MATKKPVASKKYYSVAQANSALPLVRAIVQDITVLARELRERQERLTRLRPSERFSLGQAYQEELQHVQDEVARDRERMEEYEHELKKLGVELKDYYTGLIDFPSWMNGHEVYLCWRLGEPEVGYWHELDTGFGGRQKLRVERDQN